MDHEVEVIGHQAEAEEQDRMFGLRHGKQIKEGAVVSVFVEDSCAAVSPIDDMICEAGDLSARDARHGGEISQEEKQSNGKVACPLFLFQTNTSQDPLETFCITNA